jgi:hypothetical protein
MTHVFGSPRVQTILNREMSKKTIEEVEHFHVDLSEKDSTRAYFASSRYLHWVYGETVTALVGVREQSDSTTHDSILPRALQDL